MSSNPPPSQELHLFLQSSMSATRGNQRFGKEMKQEDTQRTTDAKKRASEYRNWLNMSGPDISVTQTFPRRDIKLRGLLLAKKGQSLTFQQTEQCILLDKDGDGAKVILWFHCSATFAK